MMTVTKQYWDQLEVGGAIKAMVHNSISRVQIVKYAGAAQEYSPLHLDDDFAKTAGYGGVFAHSGLSLAFVHETLMFWACNARILRIETNFRRLIWPGDILSCKGVIFSKEEVNGEYRLQVDVWCHNQNIDNVMQGRVTLVLFKNEDAENDFGTFWPPLSDNTVNTDTNDEVLARLKSASLEADLAREEQSKQRVKAIKAVKSLTKKKIARKLVPNMNTEEEKARVVVESVTKKKAIKKKATKKKATKKKATKKKVTKKKVTKKKVTKKKVTKKKVSKKKITKKNIKK